jgi:hypothetical protein
MSEYIVTEGFRKGGHWVEPGQTVHIENKLAAEAKKQTGHICDPEDYNPRPRGNAAQESKREHEFDLKEHDPVLEDKKHKAAKKRETTQDSADEDKADEDQSEEAELLSRGLKALRDESYHDARAVLSGYELDTSGKKDELLDRLRDHLKLVQGL